MQWRNSSQRWGLTAVTMHWLTALTVVGLFALGLWMRSLSYYDPWYREGPFWHKSIGITLAALIVFRLIWRWRERQPAPLQNHQPWEKKLSGLAHLGLYALMALVFVTGYLISTADGRPIEVFGWFEIPATLQGLEGQEDIAGSVHYYGAIVLIVLAGLHGLAALKHHFMDKDNTLRRMLMLPLLPNEVSRGESNDVSKELSNDAS